MHDGLQLQGPKQFCKQGTELHDSEVLITVVHSYRRVCKALTAISQSLRRETVRTDCKSRQKTLILSEQLVFGQQASIRILCLIAEVSPMYQSSLRHEGIPVMI